VYKRQESAIALGARAYTVGSHIVVNDQLHRSGARSIDRLLRHEIAHFVQQTAGTRGTDSELETAARLHEDHGARHSGDRHSTSMRARLQLSPERITAIEIHDSGSTGSSIVMTLDDGSAISGAVKTNLEPGDYRAHWDAETEGLIIEPYPTTETVVYFEVNGDRPFLRRFDRLRRAIHEPIPLKVIEEGAESAPAEPAATTGLVPYIPGAIYLTPEEAKRRCEANDLPGIKVFPLRLPRGIWRLSVAPIRAWRDGDVIVVQQTVTGVYSDPMFKQDVRTLPIETFISGVRLYPNELVQVRLYDEGEKLICATGEGMLKLNDISDKAVFYSILGTAVEAALFFVPAGVIARPVAAALRIGRTGLTAAMIGTAEVAPTAFAGVASRAAVTTVEERAAGALLEETTGRALTRATTQAAERGLVSEALPAAGAATVPRLGTGAAQSVLARGTAGAVTEAGVRAVSPEVSADVEAAFTEYGGPPSGPIRPRLTRPATNAQSVAARARFDALRDGYANQLGVGPGGQVHHAIELQVLDRYPGVFTEGELNALRNMRGIPAELDELRQLHNSKIWELWKREYARLDQEIASRGLTPGTPAYNTLVRTGIEQTRDTIDYVVGPFFSESRLGLPTAY